MPASCLPKARRTCGTIVKTLIVVV
jgi:hypothetical protein